LSRSIKLKNNIYFDSSAVTSLSRESGRINLKDILNNLVGDYKNISDLNNLFDFGIYNYYIETANRPSTQINGFADWGLLLSFKTGAWFYQIAVGNFGNPILAVRTNINTNADPNGWSNWTAVP